jgi:putative membrane protein
VSNTFQWWCAATGLPWNWEWQWYPGVHIAMLTLAGGWWWLGRRHGWRERPWGWFAAGWLVLFATLDWPLGKLGAGYLASAHTLQYLLLTLVVGPAMLKSVPPDGWLRLAPPGSRRHRLLRGLTRALAGLVVYNAIVIITHLPVVVDGAMTSQVGSALIDGAWLLAGMVLWWPILAPPAFRRLTMFGKIGYLFGATILPTIPAMMMVFSDWPLYRLYELAPRVWIGMSANTDIQLAGLVMKVIGDLPLWIATAVIFFTETARERRNDDG